MDRAARTPSAIVAVAVALALSGSVGSVGSVAAQPVPPTPPPTATTAPAAPAPPAVDTSPLVPPTTGLAPEPPRPGSVMRQPERLSHRPSGFWTSNRPATGGAYRWRIMAAGGLVLAIAVFFLLRLLRRAGRERLLANR